MDECLARCVVDFSGRPYLVWRGLNEHGLKKVSKSDRTQDASSAFRFGLAREFFQGFTNEARCNLHLELLYGDEPHHIVEALFKAFADRTRLRILNLLGAGEVCVGDLVEVLGSPQPTVSRHLAALRRAGFALEKRKFVPHVTLAYLRGATQDAAMRYCAAHGLFSCGPFPVEEFHLYSSRLGNEASVYEIETSYALARLRRFRIGSVVSGAAGVHQFLLARPNSP